MCEDCTEDATMPRPGNVNQVRTKLLKHGSKALEMAHEQEVERQVGVQLHHSPTVLQFERLKVALGPMTCFGSDVYRKKRVFFLACEACEFSAGKCNPVHLVKAVGEECNARHIHSASSWRRGKASRNVWRTLWFRISWTARTKN